MERALSPLFVAAVAFALVASLLAGQLAADSQAPVTARGAEALGRAGFAYFTGIRTFIAAVLWNRLEPIFHDYYEELPLEEQVQMLPTIRTVIMLDPQFGEAYYVAAWVLARRGEVETGLDIAKQGVENNPASGLLRLNYAQILYLFGDDLDEAVRQADIAVQTATWRDAIEQHDAYAAFGAIYRAAGLTGKDAFMRREIERLDEVIGDALPPDAHDHDGDGLPDH